MDSISNPKNRMHYFVPMEDNYLSKEFMTRIYDVNFGEITKVEHSEPKSYKKQSFIGSMIKSKKPEEEKEAPEDSQLIKDMLEEMDVPG